MRRLTIAGVVLAAMVAGWLMFYLGAPREPEYQGHNLTDWLKQAGNSLTPSDDPDHPERNPHWMECRIAVRQMGTNAIPFLLDGLLAKESKVKPRLMTWACGPVFSTVVPKSWQKQLSVLVINDQHKVTERRALALSGFVLLERDAQPVEPLLIKLVGNKDPGKRLWGFMAFACTKPPKEVFVPVAVPLLKDADESIRIVAAATLQSLYPNEAEKAGVFVMFPDLRPALTKQVIEMP